MGVGPCREYAQGGERWLRGRTEEKRSLIFRRSGGGASGSKLTMYGSFLHGNYLFDNDVLTVQKEYFLEESRRLSTNPPGLFIS